MKLQEVNFQKSHKLLASRAGSSKQTIDRTAFTQPAIEIEWIAMFWIGRLRGARSVSSFCDFRKMTFRDLTAFPPFWCKKILCFSDVLIYQGVLKLICVQILLILIAWFLVSVALKKCSVYRYFRVCVTSQSGGISDENGQTYNNYLVIPHYVIWSLAVLLIAIGGGLVIGLISFYFWRMCNRVTVIEMEVIVYLSITKWTRFPPPPLPI